MWEAGPVVFDHAANRFVRTQGCIRVPMWIIPRLFVSEPYGETVYVYS